MEAQLDRQPGQHYDGVQPAGVNSGVQDEVDQQPHEKKSMFRKVKDKAKKLKNSITKHGNGGQDDDDDEDDDDETITKHEDGDEMEVDPAVHASSGEVARHGLHSEKPTAIGEDPYSIPKTVPVTPRSGYATGGPTAGEPEEKNGLPLPNIPEKRVLDPTSVKDEGIQQEGVKFGNLEDLEDAQDPKGGSNYQTKSIDHTGKGGQEADVASLIQSFEKTGLHGKSGGPGDVHGESGVPGGVHGESGGVRGDSGVPHGLHGDSGGVRGDSGVLGGLHGDSGGVRGESGALGGLHGDSGGVRGESGALGGLHGDSGGVRSESGVHGGIHGDSGGVRDESGIHGEPAPKIAELRGNIGVHDAPELRGNIGVHDAPASTGSHAQFAPESTGSHAQFAPESYSADKTANPTGIHDQSPPESFSFSTDKTANPTGSHDQSPPESFSAYKTANPTGSEEQFPSESFSAYKTANPTGNLDQFSPKSFPTDKAAYLTDSLPKSSDHIKPEHLHHDTTEQKPSDQGSYIGRITSAAPSVITDTAISAKNVVASKLGYGPTKDVEAPRTTDDISGATKPASITDKAISAKNVVASKLGYGSTKDADAPRTEEIAGDTKPVSDLETREFEESEKPASITDKVISAKNVVASKLGYGGTKDADAPRTEEIAGATKPVSALETGEVEGSAKPASITDKVISAKNAVASKLGYGGTKDAETTEHIGGATKPVSGLETGEVQGTTKPASSPTYVQGMTAKVTETLAPVYAKVADTGSSVISRVTGAGGKEGTTVSGDDKGTSVKEYLYEKFKPGEEEKALSREISDALHIRKEKTEEEPRTLGKVVDATGEEPKVLAEAKKVGDDVKAVGPEDVNKGVVDYVKDTVSSWVGKGGGQQQQHTQGSSDSHAASVEVPLPGETGEKMD